MKLVLIIHTVPHNMEKGEKEELGTVGHREEGDSHGEGGARHSWPWKKRVRNILL